MHTKWMAALAVCGCVAGTALATEQYPSTTVSLGLLADADHGRSTALSAALAASERWSFTLGGGHTDIGNAGATLAGDSFNASLAWRPGHWSIEPGYSHWRDDDHFSSETPELRVGYGHAGWRWQLIGERPGYALDYQLAVGPLAVQRHFAFRGTGIGAGASYDGQRWSASVSGTGYRYGDEITRLRAVLGAPNLARFPRLALLAQSFATLAESAADNRWSASVERSFTRASLHADGNWQTDALTGARAASVSVGVEVALGAHASLDASAGNQHAEGLGDSAFVHLIVGFNW